MSVYQYINQEFYSLDEIDSYEKLYSFLFAVGYKYSNVNKAISQQKLLKNSMYEFVPSFIADYGTNSIFIEKIFPKNSTNSINSINMSKKFPDYMNIFLDLSIEAKSFQAHKNTTGDDFWLLTYGNKQVEFNKNNIIFDDNDENWPLTQFQFVSLGNYVLVTQGIFDNTNLETNTLISIIIILVVAILLIYINAGWILTFILDFY